MFSLIDIPYIQYLEIEPTTFCNAGCPLCSRHKPGTSDLIDELVLEHLPKHILEKMRNELNAYQTAKEVCVFFCGNYGDAIMHPEFEWLYWYSAQYFKSVGVHTNGGARSTDFWKELGKISKPNEWGFSNASITFAIDGLEDTNHLYRRNVKWEKLMSNVEAFINSGGTANWKYIVFDHNKHQVDEARELAKKLGFNNFTSEISTRQPPIKTDMEKAVESAKKLPEIKIKRVTELEEYITKNIDHEVKATDTIQKKENLKYAVVEDIKDDVDCISCKGIATRTMFLNPKGRLWPCCFHSEEYDTTLHHLRKVEPWLADHYVNDFNNLNKKSLKEIFEASAWKEMTDAWTTKDHELRKCWKECKNSRWKISNTTVSSNYHFE